MMRAIVVALFAAALLGLAGRAVGQPPAATGEQKIPTDRQAASQPVPLELQLPDAVSRALSRIATKPPEPVEVRLPESVTKALSDIAVALEKPEPPQFSFEEKWLWLGAFVLVALGAVGFGWRNSRHAGYLDHQTSDAREKREAIRLGESGAQKLFDDLLQATRDNIRKQNYQWLRFTCWPLLIVGCGVLLGIAIMPDLPGGDWALKARQATWQVVDSNFSTAFAGVWLALLYFWGATQQRKVAARDSFNMVTEEAKQIAMMRISKAARDLYREYIGNFDAVASLPFDPPWFRPSGPDDVEAITAFNLIAARATLLAQGTKLAAGDDRIAIENERLKNLVRRGFFGRTPDFLTFVKLLRRDGSIPAEDSDWVRVVTAIEASDAEPIKAAVRNLSAKLVSESAKQS